MNVLLREHSIPVTRINKVRPLEPGEEIDGCPIVRLPDLAADWTYVLAGLYNASYVDANDHCQYLLK